MNIKNLLHNITRNSVLSSIIPRLMIICILAGSLNYAFAATSEAFYASADESESSQRFAASSVLKSGKWAKVKVEKTGMQFVSASTLRNLGFSNISKVNVYGFGGRIIPETISPDDPDDLPILPVLRSDAGIWFFGYNHIRWNKSNSTGTNLSFAHEMQPYAEESWYFLSDKDSETYTLPVNKAKSISGLPVVETFSQMLLHENDLFCPASSGRTIVGEDFRSPTRQSFTFNLTDLANGTAYTKISFASNTSGGGSLMVYANGKRLASSSNDNFSAITNSDQYFLINNTKKSIPNPDSNLKLEIAFQNSGTVKLARLDYIEVEYPRSLNLNKGELFFNTNLVYPSAVKLKGVSSSTILWDVTDPVRPEAVELTISGSVGTFRAEPGTREYIAFTPGSTGQSVSSAQSVGNQDIHALQAPELLIIAPSEYKSAAQRLAEHHRDFDKMDVRVLCPQEIYNEFSSGTPDPSAFRRLMKMWHTRQPDVLKYCLIMSRPTYDHKRLAATTKAANYPRIPIWQSPTGYSKNTSYSTDDFIGMLEDCPKSFNISTARINISVGRMPVTSLSEANAMVDKYINYATNPIQGNWRNHILMIADDQDNGIHLNQAENAYKYLSTIGRGQNFLIERLYLDSYKMEAGATGNVYPAAKKKLLQSWNNEGISMLFYIGHASTVGWTHENLLNWNDIQSFSNKKLPFLYAATCEFARYDEDERSGAEVLWANTEGGIIGTICPSRTVFMSPNGTLSTSFSQAFFRGKADQPGRRMGDIYRESKNGITSADDNKLRFSFIGNPAMRFPVPPNEVRLDSINHVKVSVNPENYPVLTACSKVDLAGVITNPEGEVDKTFSGTLDILLYDAMTVIETLGNGSDGVVTSYNDRNTLLYRGSVKIKDGKWTANIIIPSEITNNYSPARLVFYANSDNRQADDPLLGEAHGQAENFYVYGVDKDAPEDSQGPVISSFAINRSDFQNGGVVNDSPVVIASLSDPSGINLSDAGIGHKLTLILDGEKYYDDVNSYYEPTPNDFTSGSIHYPLSNVATGKHSLKLIAWDNLGNSSSATLDFEVAANLPPQIYDLFTDVNPAKEKVNFTLSTDHPMTKIEASIEVFDLNGCKVWETDSRESTDLSANLSIGWDLKDKNGTRIPRGIYLYRATIISDSGASATKTKKLAVAAP